MTNRLPKKSATRGSTSNVYAAVLRTATDSTKAAAPKATTRLPAHPHRAAFGELLRTIPWGN